MRIERVVVGETNCYGLRGEGGAIVVDPGPPGGVARLLAGLERVGVSAEEIRLILVTHAHLDHYGCAAQLQAWCGAPVAAFHSEPALSHQRRYTLPPAQTLRGSLVRWAFLLLAPRARLRPLEADLLLDEGADLSEYGVEARTICVPGHSPGSLALVTPAGDVFVGDLLVNYTVPSQPIYLWDRAAWQQSYERVRALEPRMVHVGHGDPFPGEGLGLIWPARYQFRWWVW